MSKFLERLKEVDAGNKGPSPFAYRRPQNNMPDPEKKLNPDDMQENNLLTDGCKGCGEKKTIGALDLAKALLSGKTTKEVATARMAICKQCQHKEAETGVRLCRNVKGQVYCGQPRMGRRILRDETRLGCGCPLVEKVWYNDTACPLNEWGPQKKKDKE